MIIRVSRGKSSTLRQLQICCHLYAVDHADRLPPNNFLYDISGQPLVGFSTNATWCPGLTRYDTTPANIEQVLLSVIENPEHYGKIAARGMSFARRYHDGRLSAHVLTHALDRNA